jgi:hypothetical protein
MPVLDPSGDLGGVVEFLRREPVLNTVPLGLVAEAAADPDARAKWFVATVERDSEVVAVAYRTDFPKMGLAAPGDPEAMVELARLARDAMPDLPCAIGPATQLEWFRAEWERLTGNPGSRGMHERLHRLVAVRRRPMVAGSMTPATAADRALVVEWLNAFATEAGVVQAGVPGWAEEAADRDIGRGSIQLWSDGGPVCLAGARLTGEGVARVGPVYTPLARRRRGYAGALVAGLSQQLLDAGCHTCCLYTDLGNPTSNHVYAEVGYEPVIDVSEVWFDRPPGAA